MAIKTPHIAVDGIIEVYQDNALQGIVLIERKNPPHGYALPGGFVDVGESVETALIREMKEEVNLDIKDMELLGVYSSPERDPRFHVVSVVYTCKAYTLPIAADDAKNVQIVSIEDINKITLAFDHNRILTDFINIKLK